MSSLKALFVLFASILILMLGVGLFNYQVDPQCFYNCPEVDIHKASVNAYYKTAQTILAHPETEQIIVGSSRAQTTPPQWLEQVSGLKTLNVATAGAEVMTKVIFTNMAQSKTALKRVIWFADFFELISDNIDTKIKNTDALRKYLPHFEAQENPWLKASHWTSLIDHNTFEAAIYHLKHQERNAVMGKGPGSDLYEGCIDPNYKGKETPESLSREVQMMYQNYVHGPIKGPQNENAWSIFEEQIVALTQKKIEVIVVVIPYHPLFLQQLQKEHPEIYQRHEKWIQNIQELSEKTSMKFVNAFQGIDGDDGSPKFWDDGVHFTCFGSMKILMPILKSQK